MSSTLLPADQTLVVERLPMAELAMNWSCRGAFGWLIGFVAWIVVMLLGGLLESALPVGPVTNALFGGLILVSVLAWPVFSLAALPYASFLTFRAFFQPESRKQRWYALVINLLAWGVGGVPSLLTLVLAAGETGS